MIQVQLDLFKSPQECEVDALRFALDKTSKTLDKVRKGTYAEINVLKKRVLELEERLAIIERNICKG
jgi:hypothetical protein